MFYELRKIPRIRPLCTCCTYTRRDTDAMRNQLTLGLARASMAFILLRLRLAVVARLALVYKIIRLAARDRNRSLVNFDPGCIIVYLNARALYFSRSQSVQCDWFRSYFTDRLCNR